MTKIYCPKCDKNEDAKIIIKDETYNIKGSEVKIKANVAQCKKCGEEVFDEELDGNNLEAAYNLYRKMHELLTPSQIKAIREKYDLSQRALGTLLEWGEITVHRYESGGIQDKVHNDVLAFIESPDNMKSKFEQSGRLLPPYVQVKLKERINQLIEEEIAPKFESALEQRLMPKEQMTEFTGFKRFDLEK